ncbi:MAG: redox-sensing transcriptional repressor Rex [Oscillospiraceae bacterium]
MKRSNISNNVIRRLPRYLRKLEDLAYHGIDRISSSELGKQMGLTSSQIRQDFSCFGEFGQQGYGYNVEGLRYEISNILGMRSGFSVILVGVGNLGHALLENFGFEKYGFNVLAAFDIRPELVGTTIADIPIYDGATKADFIRENDVDIAVLAVSKRMAKDVAQGLVNSGIKAIWNFTNIELDIKDPNVIVENIHFSDSLLVLSYYLYEKLKEANDEH